MREDLEIPGVGGVEIPVLAWKEMVEQLKARPSQEIRQVAACHLGFRGRESLVVALNVEVVSDPAGQRVEVAERPRESALELRDERGLISTTRITGIIDASTDVSGIEENHSSVDMRLELVDEREGEYSQVVGVGEEGLMVSLEMSFTSISMFSHLLLSSSVLDIYIDIYVICVRTQVATLEIQGAILHAGLSIRYNFYPV